MKTQTILILIALALMVIGALLETDYVREKFMKWFGDPDRDE